MIEDIPSLLDQVTKEYLHPALKAAGVVDPERYVLMIEDKDSAVPIQGTLITLNADDVELRARLIKLLHDLYGVESEPS